MGLIRSMVLRVIPLLVAAAAAHATSVFNFGSSVNFTCMGTEATCTGSGSGSIVAPSGVTLYTTPSVSDVVTAIGGNIGLQWMGTGSGLIPLMIPIDWDFSITPSGSASNITWDIQVVLGSTTVYNSGFQSLGSNPVIGSTEINTGSLSGTTMGNWDVFLQVEYGSTGGGGVTIAAPQGTSIDLGSASSLSSTTPEPATLALTGGGILLAIFLKRLKLGH